MADGAPKIGLALGGGAARGWAHLGVIEALEAAGLRFHAIAGTSIGSVIGAAQAGGKRQALRTAALALDWKDILYRFVEVRLHRSGLLDGAKIAAFLRPHLAATRIEDLPLPFACVATDLLQGEAVVLDRGDLLHAVRCSISIPGLFTPVLHEGRVVVDGGVVNPVPVDVARRLGADFVLAVDINHGRLDEAAESIPEGVANRWRDRLGQAAEADPGGWLGRLAQGLGRRLQPTRLGRLRRYLDPNPVPNIFDVIGNAVMTMEARITELNLRLHPPDFLLRPEVARFRILDFDHAEELIAVGRACVEKALPALREALARAGRRA
jgi:NTE family protein